MGVLGNGGDMDGVCGLPPFDVTPRVFVRKPDEEYVEITGITSFERSDDAGAGIIGFGLSQGLAGSAKEILSAKGDFVDVKMEFMIGMLMVMSFSGFVEQVSDSKVSFSLSTPVSTDVVDVAQ